MLNTTMGGARSLHELAFRWATRAGAALATLAGLAALLLPAPATAQTATTTAVSSSANPAYVNQSFTLTATVSPSAATGTVTFRRGNTTMGTATLSGGVATFTTSFSTTGNRNITAVYGGGGGYSGSTSPVLVQSVIARITTTTTITSSVNPTFVGQSTTLTATVSPSAATGTVTFRSGSTSLGTATLSGGVATFTTSFSTSGSRNLTARYEGSVSHNTSTSAAVSQVVNAKVNTTTTLNSAPMPSFVDQSTTLTATVSPSTATGTVTFKDGAATLGTGTLASGVATFSTSFAAAGSRSLTAVYAGDVGRNGSTSAVRTHTVNAKANTTTSIASSVNPSNVGQNTTLTATVSPSSATGTVTFKDGAATLGTGTLASGVATLTTSFASAGPHSLTAVYAGDVGNNTSTSTALNQTVNATQVSTTTTLSATPNPATAGQSVSLSATVSGSSPTGTVTFKDGAITLGTGTLSAGVATFSTSFLTVGNRSLTASYPGDSGNAASTSSALTLPVNPATSQTALAANPGSIVDGALVTLTATVTGAAPSGIVSFSEGANALGIALVSGGTATLTTAIPGVGAHSVTASYQGDANNSASTSSAASVQVAAAPPLPNPPSSPAPVTGFEYDANGNPTKTTQAPGTSGFGFATISTYDKLNRLTTSTDARSGITTLGYNGRQDLTQVTDPRNLVTQYPRNGLGDVNQLISPDTGTATHTYDAAGNLLTRTDSRGALAGYTYDALNRLTQVAYTLSGQASQTFVYTYDQTGVGFANGIGRLTSTTHPAGSTQLVYDAQGRVTQHTQRINAQAGANAATISLNVIYGYDSGGRLTTLQYPSGRTLSLAYDAAGQPQSLSLAPSSGGTATALITQIQWEPFGAAKSWQWQLGAATRGHERLYDGYGRIVRYRLGNTVRDISYDAADRISGYTHYDALTAAAATSLDQSFGYDELARLTTIGTASASWSIGYDANGNRTGVTLNGTTRNYTTSTTSNRLDAVSNPTRSLAYDAAGNTTADSGAGSPVAYTATYDAAGRLATLTQGGVTSTYAYDGDGRRVRKFGSNAAASTITFAYDQGGQLIGEYDQAGAPIREYVWLNSTPVAVFTPGANQGDPPEVFYIHSDHLDTPRIATDTDGNLRWRWLAEPFGTTAPENNPQGMGAFTLPLRMPGQYADSESGLFYNYFRSYDGSVGRYTQSDPIGLAGGINTYAYVGGNPISNVDPNGLQGVPGMCIAVGFNVASQLFSNGGDWRQIDLGEVAVAGLTGFFLPGAIGAVRQAATTGSTRALTAAGAGIGVRGASSMTSGGGGPYPNATMGDLFPGKTDTSSGSCPAKAVDRSGPYPTGPGVVCFGR